MPAKVITSLLLLIVNLGAGAGFLFMLLLSLNGFSERDTNLSFYIYFAGIIFVTFLTIGLGILSIHFLTVRKGFNAVLAAAGVLIFLTVIITVADFVLMLVSAVVAGEVRKSHLL